MSIVDSIEGMFAAGDSAADAGQVLTGVASQVSAVDPGISAGLGAQDIADIDAAAPGVGAAKADSPWLPTWATKAIEPVMTSLTQAALRPRRDPVAPAAAGHGVNASAGGAMKPFQEVEKMANDDPLNGLNQWSHLF